jgi:hypothetical protein
MKTYFVLFLDFREETIRASSVRLTSKLISFYRGKTLVLAVPVSEIRRIGETKFKSFEELEQEAELNPKLEAARAWLAQRREVLNGQTAN